MDMNESQRGGGTSDSGKSTLARRLAQAMSEPYIEMGLMGAKLQNATSDFFELDLSKNNSAVKWLP